MSQKTAKIVRVSTVAPLMAAGLILLLYLIKPDSFLNVYHFLAAILFLTILPLLSYPTSVIIPALREKGRSGQRSLSIIFAVCGYVLGVLFCIIFGCAKIEFVLYMTYLLSGVIIALLSFVFKIKGSGHACGVSGPIAMLTVYLGTPFMLGYFILWAVFASSLKLKRHTVSQLLIGSIVPVVSLAVSIIASRMFF